MKCEFDLHIPSKELQPTSDTCTHERRDDEKHCVIITMLYGSRRAILGSERRQSPRSQSSWYKS